MGPLKYQSCAKFESFHQLSKKYAHVVKSRKNIISTLAIKLQLDFSYRLVSQKGFNNRIELGRVIELSSALRTKFSQHFGAMSHELLSAKINGMLYTINNAVYLGMIVIIPYLV